MLFRLRIGTCYGPTEICSDCSEPHGLDFLESLDGLESLTEVGDLQIWGNLVLVNIDGLVNLETAQTMSIHHNPILSQAAVDSFRAGVVVLGDALVEGNGTGVEPSCGGVTPQ